MLTVWSFFVSDTVVPKLGTRRNVQNGSGCQQSVNIHVGGSCQGGINAQVSGGINIVVAGQASGNTQIPINTTGVSTAQVGGTIQVVGGSSSIGQQGQVLGAQQDHRGHLAHKLVRLHGIALKKIARWQAVSYVRQQSCSQTSSCNPCS